MLAAASAWRILEAEHTRLRQLLAAIESVLVGGAWQRPGPQRDQLRQLIQDFLDFENQTHRPKGVVLMDSMRGRSAQADQLLDALDQESQQCGQLLAQALAQLDALEQAGGADGGDAASLLQQHRTLMLRHLECEDTAFRAFTAQLLTSEEWSAVASAISSVVQKVRRANGR